MSSNSSVLSRQPQEPLLLGKIIALRDRGLSRSQIGKTLGVSKNVVTGILWRWAPQPVAKAIRGKPPEIPDVGLCRFIFGVTLETYRFCAAPVVAEKPYCAEHCAVCYVPRKAEGE